MSLLKRDDAAGELKHREVVVRQALPPDQQPAKTVVPAVGPLDDPPPRLASHASDHRNFPSTSDVRRDAAAADRLLAVGVVVSLVETQVSRTERRSEQATKDYSVEDLGNEPLVVHVRSGDRNRQRHAAAVGENMPFYAEFSAVRRVRPGVAPPLGAFAMALSSDAKSHLMPRLRS